MSKETIARNRASLEFIAAEVTGNVDLTMPVEMAVTRGQPANEDWHSATWVGDPAPVREARVGPEIPNGLGAWRVYVRLTDSPEVPVIWAYTLFLT